MATRRKKNEKTTPAMQREPPERRDHEELAALIESDQGRVPSGWKMSPRAVCTYIMGGEVNGTIITPKYLGAQRVIEVAIATLLTERTLLLVGHPGTAKSRVSEHLAAAISGDSTRSIQGTMGTAEANITYGWNVGQTSSQGLSRDALVPSPIYRAMEAGSIARFEALGRCPLAVQDALIPIVAERRLLIPELDADVVARPGFGLIATCTTYKRGASPLSVALQGHMNQVELAPPDSEAVEVEVVRMQVRAELKRLGIALKSPYDDQLEKVVRVLRELRSGQTADGKSMLKTPSGELSGTEVIAMLTNSMALASHFGDGVVCDEDLALGLTRLVVKKPAQDQLVWREYLENVMKKRDASWKGLYRACSELVE